MERECESREGECVCACVCSLSCLDCHMMYAAVSQYRITYPALHLTALH